MDTLFLNNDHIVELKGLQDANGDFVGGATVLATLYQSDGVTEVLGVSWPLVLNYQGARGTYRGELPASVAVEDKGRYKLKLEATSIGKRYEVIRAVVAEVRYG